MAEAAGAKLYTPALLALSVELAEFPFDPAAPMQGRAKSRTCGSEVVLSCSQGLESTIDKLGLQVTACAVGQASAALFASFAKGRNADEIPPMLDQVEAWINGDAPSSAVPRLELLEPARAFPARHAAILLPWRAAIDALSSSDISR